MTIDGDVLEIELDMELDDVCELKEFVSTRLKYIEEISFIGGVEEFSTSSLFSLLFAMKKSKPEIKIPLIDEGVTGFKNYGKVIWT